MKRLLVVAAFALVLLSCKENNVTQVEGKIDGVTDGVVTLRLLNVNQLTVIDTIKLNSSGEFNYSLKLRGEEPDFYYLYHNEKRVASLLLKPRERVRVVSNLATGGIEVNGSEESQLFNQLEMQLASDGAKFDSLYTLSEEALVSGDRDRAEELNLLMGRHYVEVKRRAIRAIYDRPNSPTNIILLFHHFRPELPLFSSIEDWLFFERVADSLALQYPALIYLNNLRREVESRTRAAQLSSKLEGATESSYPDLILPDINSTLHQLSSLEGKVILLSFWSVEDNDQKMLNNEYRELYQQFHKRGFEIYQVSVDRDKTAWAQVVKAQQLPWLSLCDGLGASSPAVLNYNVEAVPTNYLIGRDGVIVGKNLSQEKLKSEIRKLL